MRIGVLGCGKQAEKHVAALKKIPDTEIVVADVVRQAALELARQLRVQVASSPDALLDDEAVEAVDVCAPTPAHKSLIIQGLRQGKHVFCEKPLCLTMDEALEIQAAAKDTDRTIMVGYHHRFHPAFHKVKEALEDNVIGKPYLALFRMGGRGSHKAWKHHRSSGGGAIFEILVHKLALISWMFGPVSSAEMLLRDLLLPRREAGGEVVQADAEDIIVVRLRCDGNVSVLCESDLATPGFMDYMEVQGDSGSIFSSMLHYMPTDIFCAQPRGIYNQGHNVFHFEQYDLFRLELEHFVEVIKGRRQPVCTLQESLDIMRIIHRLDGPEGRYELARELSLEL